MTFGLRRRPPVRPASGAPSACLLLPLCRLLSIVVVIPAARDDHTKSSPITRQMPKRLIVESSASRSGASRSASFSGAPKALSPRRRRRRRRPGRRRRRPRRPCRPRRPPSSPLLLSSSLRAPSILCPCHSRRSHRRCRRGPSLPSHIFPRPSSCSSSPLPTCPHPPRRPLLATPNRSQIEADQGGSGRRQRAARGWEAAVLYFYFLGISGDPQLRFFQLR